MPCTLTGGILHSQVLEEAGNLLCPLVSQGFTLTIFADVVGYVFFFHSLAEMLEISCPMQSEALHCSCFAVMGRTGPMFLEKRGFYQ